YTDRRLGNRVTLGKRFNYTYSALLTLRTELVDIGDINDKPVRAQEILDLEGGSSIISTILQVRRDTTNRGQQPSRGTTTTAGRAEIGFPLAGDTLRGVVFTDMGTVERDVAMRDFRASVGAGIRLALPLGQTPIPIAIDFAIPVSKSSEDDVQYISFSLGVGQ